MKYAKLRIAVTALSLTACVLLIALWMRSYWRWEHVALGPTAGQGILVGSANGAQHFQYDDDSGTAWRQIKWHVRSLPAPEKHAGDRKYRRTLVKKFYWHATSSGFVLCVPYWFFVSLAIALAAAPWIQWFRRFSLHTLLVAMTLVAVVLGIIIGTS